ncbi:MAG: tail fiber domain-containing protein [Melioribacteraceae bacterium]|nr:tail fiber domain-containing protein [Melioribacteraceae bacterium]
MNKRILNLGFLFVILAGINIQSQNITNTLGSNGVFAISDNSTTFFYVRQPSGIIELNYLTPNIQQSSIFKGANRFLHTYYDEFTDGNNTFIGVNSGNFSIEGLSATGGSYNTGVGANSLLSLTDGSHNSALGGGSLYSTIDGYYNSAHGYASMYYNTEGLNNSAFGSTSLYSNTYGDNNSAFGYRSLYSQITNSDNSAFGVNSHYNNKGYNNSVFGYNSQYSSGTSGYENSTFGAYTLQSNYQGHNNSAFGFGSLYSHTAGESNSAIGYKSLYTNDECVYNTALGYFTLYHSTDGSHISAIGYQALLNNTTGVRNSALGYDAGSLITTGSNNIAIGYDAQVPSGSSSNQIRVGNTSITYAGVQVAWTVTSDKRWKENIQSSPLGLEFISKLNPVIYTRNNDEKQRTEFGLIAQELEEVLKEFNIENPGMLTIDDDGYYHLRYNDLLSPMIKAIQELGMRCEELRMKSEKQIADLRNQHNNDFNYMVDRLSEYENKLKILTARFNGEELDKIEILTARK